ncbi:hypothetical protein NDU88_001900 [Pleurodeles waltl]|uniref:Uncharacterized protein n=1 Tax=Pleurodeles waltl TaxID=8319 RepID=A0AAV7KU22_PLEWA|nr:hypothetical protein NDU88_001900 [Pleurodeles waltl]
MQLPSSPVWLPKMRSEAGASNEASLLLHKAAAPDTYASCYSTRPALRLLGVNRNSYLAIFARPPCRIGHRQQQLTYRAPEMTLCQISELINVLRQLRMRDAREGRLSNSLR